MSDMNGGAKPEGRNPNGRKETQEDAKAPDSFTKGLYKLRSPPEMKGLE
jgi:hypothetical protein